MKVGEFFIELAFKGDDKKLKQAVKTMEDAERKSARLIKYRKDLAKASTEEEKKLIKQNFAAKVQLDNTNKLIKAKQLQKASILGVVKGLGNFVKAASLAITIMDRLINATAKANQQMVTLSRTSGVSLSTIGKYASASAAVNYNASPEATAQSLSRVSQNLYDIRMGRGDISPYQELGFFGGKSFNPYGMSVEQVVEQVRESIKGLNDIQATDIITRMGFSPDDLLMLRMSRQEFEKIQSMFLSTKEQEAMNQYSLRLKQIHLQFNLMKDKAILAILPYFNKLMKILSDINEIWTRIGVKILDFIRNSEGAKTAIKGIAIALAGLLVYLHPVIAAFTALYLILEDIAVYFLGGKSVTGLAIEGLKNMMQSLQEGFDNSGIKQFFTSIGEGIKDLATIKIPGWLSNFFSMIGNNALTMGSGFGGAPVNTNNLDNRISSNNFNQDNSIIINTNQPVAETVGNKIADYTSIIGQNFNYA